MAYTSVWLREKICEAAENMPAFYKSDFVNYRGVTTDTCEPYTEVVAGYLLEHPELLAGIPKIYRERTYKTPGHDGRVENPDSPRQEEVLAKSLFHREVGALGRVLDYQVPIKNVSGDEAGKVDLVSDDGAHFYLLELKKAGTYETLLRCVLEILTYRAQIDEEHLLESFQEDLSGEARSVEPAELIFRQGQAAKELQKVRAGARPQLAALLERYGVQVFLLSDDGTTCEQA